MNTSSSKFKIRKHLKFLKSDTYTNSYFKKILLYFTGTTCILFLIFTTIISSSIINNYKENVEQNRLDHLDYVSNLSDNILSNIYHYCYSLFINNISLNNILHAKTYTPEASIEFSKINKSILDFNTLIDSIYIINNKADMVFTSEASYVNIKDFYDQDIIEKINNSNNSPVSFYIPREVTKSPYETLDTPKKVLTLIFHDVGSSAFVINLNQSIYTKLTNPKSNEYSDTVIINSEGTVISESDAISFMDNLTDMDWFQQILFNDSSSGIIESVANSPSGSTILFKKDANLDFTYIITLDFSIFGADNSLLTKTLLYLILFIIIAWILSILISWSIYMPILNLKVTIQQFNTSKDTSKKDEITYITDTVKQLIDNNTSLKRDSIKLIKNEKNKFLLNFIQQVNYQSYLFNEENYDQLQINLEGDEYLVIVFSLDGYMNTQDNDNGFNFLLTYSLENIASELFDSHYTYECVRLPNSNVCYILNINEANDKRYLEVLDKAQKLMFEYFSKTVSIGIGTIAEDESEIHISYTNALAALNYRFIYGNNSLISYDQAITGRSNSSSPDYMQAQSIANTISSGKLNECMDYIDSFFKTLINHDFNSIILNILSLNTIIQKEELLLGLPQNDLLTIDNPFYLDYSYDEIKEYYKKRCKNNIEAYQEIKKKTSKKPAIIKEVIDIIDNNKFNPDLTVENIASEVNLSTNYLRSLFKENMGISLSKYIDNIKLEMACKFLKETDEPVQAICDKLKFTTSNYFYSYFKKHMGMTPIQYRNLHREE